MWDLETIIAVILVIVTIIVILYVLYKLANPSVPNGQQKFYGLASLSDMRVTPGVRKHIKGSNSDPMVRVTKLDRPDGAEFDWFVLP